MSCVLNSEMPVNSRCHIVDQFNRDLYQYIIASDDSGLTQTMNSKSEKVEKDEKDEKNKNRSFVKRKRYDFGFTFFVIFYES